MKTFSNWKNNAIYKNETTATFSFCLPGVFFKSLQVRPGVPKTSFGDCWHKVS